MLCTTPACFSTFSQSTMVPTLVEIPNFLVYLSYLTTFHIPFGHALPMEKDAIWNYLSPRDLSMENECMSWSKG